jgi:hypothetical protein
MTRIFTAALAFAVIPACTTPAFQALTTSAPVTTSDAFSVVIQQLHARGYTIVSSSRETGSVIAEKDAGTSLTFSTEPEDIRKMDRLEVGVYAGPDQQTSVRVMPVSMRQIGNHPPVRDQRPSRTAVADAEAIVQALGSG